METMQHVEEKDSEEGDFDYFERASVLPDITTKPVHASNKVHNLNKTKMKDLKPPIIKDKDEETLMAYGLNVFKMSKLKQALNHKRQSIDHYKSARQLAFDAISSQSGVQAEYEEIDTIRPLVKAISFHAAVGMIQFMLELFRRITVFQKYDSFDDTYSGRHVRRRITRSKYIKFLTAVILGQRMFRTLRVKKHYKNSLKNSEVVRSESFWDEFKKRDTVAQIKGTGAITRVLPSGALRDNSKDIIKKMTIDYIVKSMKHVERLELVPKETSQWRKYHNVFRHLSQTHANLFSELGRANQKIKLSVLPSFSYICSYST